MTCIYLCIFLINRDVYLVGFWGKIGSLSFKIDLVDILLAFYMWNTAEID